MFYKVSGQWLDGQRGELTDHKAHILVGHNSDAAMFEAQLKPAMLTPQTQASLHTHKGPFGSLEVVKLLCQRP